MELDKISNKLSKLSIKLENAYANDINKIIEEIFFEYDIYYKSENVKVDKEIILNKFKKVFNKNRKSNIHICIGFSKNGNKCVRKALPENDYCKIHTYLAFKQVPQQIETEPFYIIDKEQNSIDKCSNNISDLKEEFIEDSFYYVDGVYAYDKTTKEKAGIYDEKSQSYYITDDPFILS